MTDCPCCKNNDRNKFIGVRFEEDYGVGRIKAIVCLVCGIVFVAKEELDKYISHYYK